MIGDATNPEDVNQLMNGDLADTIYCDPPKSRDAEDYPELIQLSLVNIIDNAKEDFHVLYWTEQEDIHHIQKAYGAYGIDNSRVAIWIKRQITTSPNHAFARSYEPCVYGVQGKPYLNDNFSSTTEIVNRNLETGIQQHDEIFHMVDIWVDNTRDEEAYHPKQKPASLHEKPLKRITAPGHIVVDLFGGAGSTLLACEQLGRRARIMETSPLHATTIIERWQDYTGRKAKQI
jgi:site-specific DNA-methyltransferase (adenine-specific)